MLDDDTVLQLSRHVVKPHHKNGVEFRLKALESSIADVKNLLFQNKHILKAQYPKEPKNKAPESGFEPELEPRQFRI
ncbi:MAG TPA: hypothetical protein VEG44_06315 [Candidatus Acidoferrales bacterium]|nr:hypothetical protein [Candidatus Acidoferrales bacterium]